MWGVDGSVGSGRSMAVAAVQLNSRDDPAANVAAVDRLVERAAGQGARLIALPEVWPYLGPDEGAFAAAEPIPGPLTDRLAELARKHRVFLHGGSIYERMPGDEADGHDVPGRARMANTTVVFDPDGNLVARYRKIHLFDVELAGGESYRESDTIVAGDEVVTVEIDGVTVGLAICYDLRFPELFRILALRGAELIVLPAAFTLTTGRDHWEVLLRARAIENGCFVLAPGQVGTHPPGKACFGRSMIVDPWGTVLAQAPDDETTVGATLDLGRARAARRQIPALANRRPAAYRWPETGEEVAPEPRLASVDAR